MKTSKKQQRNRVQSQEVPVNDTPSNAKGDQLSVALFCRRHRADGGTVDWWKLHLEHQRQDTLDG